MFSVKHVLEKVKKDSHVFPTGVHVLRINFLSPLLNPHILAFRRKEYPVHKL
jgi:hypothetical protein